MNITDNHRNKAWKEMVEILDKEMPENKRKNRLFFIIFLSIGLLGLLFYATSNKFFDKNQEEIQYKKTDTINRKNNNDYASATNNLATDNIIESKINNNQLPYPKKQDKSIKQAINSNANEITYTISSENNTITNNNSNNDIFDIEPMEIETIANEIHPIFPINTSENHILPQIISKEIFKSQNQKISFFNPFIFTNLFNPDFSKISPIMEIGLGNTITFNNKFYVNFNIGLMDSKLAYPEISLFKIEQNNSSIENSILEYENQRLISNYSISKIFPFISISEGYSTKWFSIELGGGMIYSHSLNNDILSQNEDNISLYAPLEDFGNNTEDRYYIDKNIIKRYTAFSQLNIDMKLYKNLHLNTGMKYYFTEFETFNDESNQNIYKSNIYKYPFYQNIYIGLKYRF